MDEERLHLMALWLVPGIGDFLLRQLVGYCGSATEVFRQSGSQLRRIPGIGEQTAGVILQKSTFSFAEAEISRANHAGARILFFTDPSYPARLRAHDDSPAALYVLGNTNLNHPRTIGVVGTRRASAYGRLLVDQLIEGLKVFDPMVVSGLAYGIDIHAHKAALKQQLPTVAVLGSGLDVIYPQAHYETARKMIDCGALITENHFGAQPDAHNFPARNRIIAGLCDAVIVVEAAESGGALITAEIANSYNKDVFAFPGNVGSVTSEGCNKLIKTHRASLLTSWKDIAYIMNWEPGPASSTSGAEQLILDLGTHESMVVKVLSDRKSPVMIDDLAVRTGLAHGPLTTTLLNMELAGIIKTLPGKAYALRGRQ